MSNDSIKTLMRSFKHFFSGTALSRLSGLMRDMAMAYAFGTQGLVAVFLMAFRFAHLLRRLFGEGAMQSAFVPLFEKIRQRSTAQAGNFFINLGYTLCCILLAIIIGGIIMASLLLSWELVNESYRHVISYTIIMLPSLAFICLFGLNASLLQCNHNYFLPGVAPVLFNIIWTAAALFLAHFPIDRAMTLLSYSIVLACFCQWAVTIPATLAFLRHLNAQMSLSALQLFSKDVRELMTPFLLAIVGVSATQINNALDVIFAHYASQEGPAYLWYAIRLQQLPLALFGIAISGAILPPLTRALKNEDFIRFNHYLSFALRRVIQLMLPMTAGIFLLGDASIQFLYGYGDFQQTSIDGTLQCLWGYGAGLLPMTCVLIFAPAFYAKENYKLPTKASLLAMCINISLNAWFVMGLHLGPASVALATSLSALANACCLGYFLKSHLIEIYTRSFRITILKTIAATSLASLAVYAASLFMPQTSKFWLGIYLLLQTLLFSTIFFAASYSEWRKDSSTL